MSTTTEESGGKKVFVGNLAYDTTEEELKTAFEKAGNVVDAKIVRRGNRSKGFGFVEFSTDEEAEKAVELLDKTNLNDRPINVQVSTSTGTKVGNNDNRSNDGGYYNDNNNYRDNNYRDNYRDNNYRDNNYRDNYRDNYRGNNDNYRDNDNDNYRDNNNDNYRENRGVGRRGGNFRRSPNFDNGGQRRYYHLKNNRYEDNYNSNRRGGNRNYNNRGGNRNYNNNNNRYRNNNSSPRSDVEKVESQTTIFVANLPFDVDDEQLITLFEKCGAIKTAHVVKNRGKSKGYGFVEFEDNEGQKKALAEMDNHQIVYKNGEDRNLSVKVAMSTGDNDKEDENTKEKDNENENENENENDE